MSADLVKLLAVAASKKGLRLHVWATGGKYQANLSDGKGLSWAVHTDPDPETAIRKVIQAKHIGFDAGPIEIVDTPNPPPIGTAFDPLGFDEENDDFDPLG